MAAEHCRRCANGSCEKTGKHLCSGCNEEIYCSKECQKTHWALHKVTCQTAVKPSSITSMDSLSAKQLKNLLKAKASKMDDKKRNSLLDQLNHIVEKPQLVKLAESHVKLSEVESLLRSADANLNNSTSSSSSVTKPKKTKHVPIAAPTPTPDQLKQQAAMIRKDPAMVRRANPAFARMSDEQIKAYADQLEQVYYRYNCIN